MNYWVIADGIEKGPFTLDQIRELRPAPHTPVWCTGLPDWTTADQLPELAQWLDYTPQQQPAATSAFELQNQTVSEPEPMPRTYLAWSIVATLLCCLVPGIIAIFCSAKVEPRWQKGDTKGAKNASDWALLWIIAAVIFGIVGLPLQLAMMSF